MALFRGGPQLKGPQLVAPMYQGIIDAERQKGMAMREAMGAFGHAINPKTIAMKKFRKEFGGLTDEQRNDPTVLRSMAATIVTEDPQAAMGLLEMANKITPKAKSSQASGKQINAQLGSNLPEDQWFNVSEKGHITPIGTGKKEDVFQIGSIPQGWEVVKDENTNALSMRPIAGGPVDEEQKAQQKRDEIIETGKQVASDVVNDNITRLRSLIQKDSLSTPVTGVTGWVASFIPATSRADAEALSDTIKANAGFDKLQSMRDASPTGGALGQVSEKENKYLQATLGNLEFSQSQEQLLYNLELLERAYNRIVHGIGPDIPEVHGDVLGILE